MKFEDYKRDNPKLARFAVVDRDGNVNHLVSPLLVKNRKIGYKVVNKLKKLHAERIDLLNLMKIMDPVEDKETLYECYKEWTEIEFKLQELWGFERDAKYHRFWSLPHCTCPVMDNDDAYPTGRYVTSMNCYHALKFHERDAEEFNDWTEEQDVFEPVKLSSPVPLPTIVPYKDPLSFRLKQLGFTLGFMVIAVISALCIYFLATNQHVIQQIAEYLVRGF